MVDRPRDPALHQRDVGVALIQLQQPDIVERAARDEHLGLHPLARQQLAVAQRGGVVGAALGAGGDAQCLGRRRGDVAERDIGDAGQHQQHRAVDPEKGLEPRPHRPLPHGPLSVPAAAGARLAGQSERARPRG